MDVQGDSRGAPVVIDRDRLAVFCREQHPRLVGMLSLYCGERSLAEELAQETLLRTCRAWDRVARADDPAAWVTTVALNLARSQFRSRDTRRRAVERLHERASREADGSDAAAAVAVRAAVAALPERERRVLVLRYYADLSVRDTARAMRCPEGTIKRLTAQGIAHLRASGLEVADG